MTVEISAKHWAGDVVDRPTKPLAVGVRLLSEQDVQEAKAEGSRVVTGFYGGAPDPEGINDAYNDALMRSCVARAITHTEDASIRHFVLGEEEIRQQLTPEGVRALFQAVESVHIGASPCMAEIDDDGCLKLAAILQRRKAFATLDVESRARVRRLLSYALDALEEGEASAEASGVAIFSEDE